MTIDPKFQPLINGLMGLVSRAAEGAVEGVLDEVQGKVREIDSRITKARKRANSKRKAPVSRDREDVEVIEGEIVDERH